MAKPGLDTNTLRPELLLGNVQQFNQRSHLKVSTPQVAWVLTLSLLVVFGNFLPAFNFFISPANYLPLHSVLEFVAMAVSAMVFGLNWNLRDRPPNSHRIILGAGFLAVGMIDVAHTLSFAGMPDLVTPSGPEKAINFWLAGRYVAAAALLCVAVLPLVQWSEAVCRATVMGAFMFAAGVWWIGIARVEWIPRTFIPGQGLTAFKIGAEYVVALLYAAVAIHLFFQSRKSRNEDLLWLAAAAWVLALAEVFFTLYVDVTDTFNLLGHVYKVAAYAMVYRALFVSGVQAPYRELDYQHAHLRALFDTIPDLIWVKSSDGIFLSCNKAFERLYGRTEEAIVGKTDFDLVDADLADLFRRSDRTAIEAGRAMVSETWITFPENGYRGLFETTRVPMFASKGQLVGVLGIAHDVTARQAADDEIKTLAFYDPLTHLANRRLMLDRLRQAIAASSRSERYGALLYVDLDHFKTLNDTLGHDIGDQLLQQVARQLLACVRDEDTVARLGGDEFLIMLEGLSAQGREAAQQAEIVGEKILAALNQSCQLAGQDYRGTCSIGISMFAGDEDKTSPDGLMKRADLAMYQAKAAGRNALRFFDPAMQSAITLRAEQEADLRKAVLEQQFVLFYQAQIDSDGRLAGVEALLRWQHPQRGLVPPLDFIALAEETALILPLGNWVLESACHQLAHWATRPEMVHLTIAVNVSARQFHRHDFVDQVVQVFERTGANPRLLKLELTESLLVDDLEDVIVKMTALKEKGVGFSLDDFGTGYSSLAYLKRLPLDQLKIDKSFVRDVLSDPNDAAIARTIVALANSLGLSVIAEGVETQEQRDFLQNAHCHMYQGYFFSRPLPIERLEEFAKSRTSSFAGSGAA